MIKIDFVTIFYNDKIEIDLLKLQAYSYQYVDINFINNIYLIYNDVEDGIEIFNSIKECYPEIFHNKIILITRLNLNLCIYEPSSWTNQQIFKLKISEIITSDYYIVLDCKNHFIYPVSCETFFSEDDKPIIHDFFVYNKELEEGSMLDTLKNYVNYFNLENNYNLKIAHKMAPFIFITEIVKKLINYIENREQNKIENFFFNNNYNPCEYYLYCCYLLFLRNDKRYFFVKINIQTTLWICNIDNINGYNVYYNKNKMISFSIHKDILKNDIYKKKLYDNNIINFYKNIYPDYIFNFIINRLLMN